MCPPVETLANNLTEGGISAIFGAILKLLLILLLGLVGRLNLMVKLQRTWEEICGFAARVAEAAKNTNRPTRGMETEV